MAELWQQICYHTYAGTPGVIPDLSGTGNFGVEADGLADANFLADGSSPRSGSVRFYDALGRVFVPLSAANAESWNPISAMKAEVTLRWQPSPAGAYTILHSDSFQFYIRSGVLVAWFAGTPLSYAEVSVHNDQVGPTPFLVPRAKWVTLGFAHDGFGAMEISANGTVVARKLGPINPVAPITGLSIGNTASGNPLNGEIDDVKIWRINPYRVKDNFFDRPLDPATIDCYKRYLAELQAAIQRHPGCAALVETMMANAVRAMLQEIYAKGPETRERWEKSAEKYQALWHAGLAGSEEMADVIANMVKWLQLIGLNLDNNPAFEQIRDSECWREIVSEISMPDCDTQLSELRRRLSAFERKPAAS